MWTTLNFGKHAGRTLPQVLLKDPNWFFWAVSKLYGPLASEAAILAHRATHIRIPKRRPKKWQVEYRRDADGRFLGCQIVKVDSPVHGSVFGRLPWFDLSYVRRGNIHDIRDCRRLIQDFRQLYFDGRNLTKRRCELFFENERHFSKAGWSPVFS